MQIITNACYSTRLHKILRIVIMTNKVTRVKFTTAILYGKIITINNAKNLYDKGHIGKDTEFSCPHHDCNAPLIFCFNPEQKKREPYFRTARGKKLEHICGNRFTIKPIVIKNPKNMKINQKIISQLLFLGLIYTMTCLHETIIHTMP